VAPARRQHFLRAEANDLARQTVGHLWALVLLEGRVK
jgi:hypothetical protein